MSDWIKFMGTAGARFVVSRQLRSSAGTWCSFQGVNLLIDPGPGTLSRCFSSKPPLDPGKLEAVILTHRHLDHSNDMNVIIEAMTRGTFHRRGVVFAPAEAVTGTEPVVFEYLRRSVEQLQVLHEGGEYRVGDVLFSTPLRHLHPAETYGLLFRLPYGCIAFIADSLFFPALAEAYAEADIVVINTVFHTVPPVKKIQHLDLAAAREIINHIKPRLAILTHFGLTMLQHKPILLAQQLSRETGCQVIAAKDGFALDIEKIW